MLSLVVTRIVPIRNLGKKIYQWHQRKSILSTQIANTIFFRIFKMLNLLMDRAISFQIIVARTFS